MMNELKMSDVFELPVRIGADQLVRQSDGKLIDFFQSERYAICDAINSYDKNQELISKLQGRIESQLALLDVSGKRIERLESENEKQADQIEMLRNSISRLSGSGVDFINSEDMDDDEDRASAHSKFNDDLIFAAKALVSTSKD